MLTEVQGASDPRAALVALKVVREKLQNVAAPTSLADYDAACRSQTDVLGLDATASTETLPGASKKRRQT